jgi:hypothetical protein
MGIEGQRQHIVGPEIQPSNPLARSARTEHQNTCVLSGSEPLIWDRSSQQSSLGWISAHDNCVGIEYGEDSFAESIVRLDYQHSHRFAFS